METMRVLEKISGAIGRVLKDARPTQRMDRAAVVEYAAAQLGKASREPPDRAVHRLEALRSTIELAKQCFVDAASEQIDVQVYEDETTASADRSEKELSPLAAERGLGSSDVAARQGAVSKALATLAGELEALRGLAGRATDWPLDLNSREFREGVRKAEDAPAWGYDPDREPPRA